MELSEENTLDNILESRSRSTKFSTSDLSTLFKFQVWIQKKGIINHYVFLFFSFLFFSFLFFSFRTSFIQHQNDQGGCSWRSCNLSVVGGFPQGSSKDRGYLILNLKEKRRRPPWPEFEGHYTR